MKSELLNSPKFKRLCRVIGLPAPYVAGLLELLWQTGYALASDAIGDAVDVEVASQWPGEPGRWHAVLVAEGWLDVDESMTSHIHDFWEHAPQYVERKRSRLNATRSKIENERSKRAAVERANKSRANRKSFVSTEVTDDSSVDSQRLASDEPMASQQLAYPTQPNPTLSSDDDTQLATDRTNEVEQAFKAIEPRSPEYGVVLTHLHSLGIDAITSPLHIGQLAELVKAAGADVVLPILTKSRNAEPPPLAAGLVGYVQKSIGNRAADIDRKREQSAARSTRRVNIDGGAKPSGPPLALTIQPKKAVSK